MLVMRKLVTYFATGLLVPVAIGLICATFWVIGGVVMYAFDVAPGSVCTECASAEGEQGLFGLLLVSLVAGYTWLGAMLTTEVELLLRRN